MSVAKLIMKMHAYPGGRLGTKVKADFGDGWDGLPSIIMYLNKMILLIMKPKGRAITC